MKKATLFLYVLSILLYASCRKDEVKGDEGRDVISKFTSEMFHGQWFSNDNSTYYDIGSRNFGGVIYKNLSLLPKVEENISGSWEFFPTNEVFRINIFYETEGQGEYRDYQVQDMDEYQMKLKDRILNTTYIYNKVVESHSLNLGEAFDIAYISKNLQFSSSTFSSTNPSIAKVDEKGHVTATGSGTAFVSIKSNVGTAVVEVQVEERCKSYSKELLSSIDDVIALYGEAEHNAFDNGYSVIAYTSRLLDASLKQIQYRYDEKTREIEGILTLYSNAECYKHDVEFIKNNYYEIEDANVENCYGPESSILVDKYYVYFRSDVNGSYIAYKNLDYAKKHKDNDVDNNTSERLQYYEFYKLMGKSLDDVAKYLGNNYSDTFVSETSITITGPNVFIPVRVYSNTFNGYEKEFQSITLYTTSRTINGLSNGNVNKIKIAFLEDVDVSNVSDKLSSLFEPQQKLQEKDGSVSVQYIVGGSYALWNETKRTLIYEYRSRTILL